MLWRLTSISCSGVKLEYLSPYSPDYNPIEESFSALKAYIRRHGTIYRSTVENGEVEDVIAWLYGALDRCVDREKTEGWFRHANYRA